MKTEGKSALILKSQKLCSERHESQGPTQSPKSFCQTSYRCFAGYMSNRGRQNVASYLILDLGIDWRKGADWFESVLTDYDVASNWGNWVAAAGLTGGRVNHFNTLKQSKVSHFSSLDFCLMFAFRSVCDELAVCASHPASGVLISLETDRAANWQGSRRNGFEHCSLA